MNNWNQGDWRQQANPAQRQQFLNNLLTLVKQLPGNQQQDMLEKAQQFESKTFAQATSWEEYAAALTQKISQVVQRLRQGANPPTNMNNFANSGIMPQPNPMLINMAQLGMQMQPQMMTMQSGLVGQTMTPNMQMGYMVGNMGIPGASTIDQLRQQMAGNPQMLSQLNQPQQRQLQMALAQSALNNNGMQFNQQQQPQFQQMPVRQQATQQKSFPQTRLQTNPVDTAAEEQKQKMKDMISQFQPTFEKVDGLLDKLKKSNDGFDMSQLDGFRKQKKHYEDQMQLLAKGGNPTLTLDQLQKLIAVIKDFVSKLEVHLKSQAAAKRQASQQEAQRKAEALAAKKEPEQTVPAPVAQLLKNIITAEFGLTSNNDMIVSQSRSYFDSSAVFTSPLKLDHSRIKLEVNDDYIHQDAPLLFGDYLILGRNSKTVSTVDDNQFAAPSTIDLNIEISDLKMTYPGLDLDVVNLNNYLSIIASYMSQQFAIFVYGHNYPAQGCVTVDGKANLQWKSLTECLAEIFN
ncbi:hypothetical protein EDD86DRAFT_211263 [Gorgonomyces haynaldii]|nr:hypothetical protein EDD86DRAFT_211263 [Gorgonomyces haynaldii]